MTYNVFGGTLNLLNLNLNLRPPNGIGHTIIFYHVVSILYLLSFFSSPNLSGRRLDVYHTSTHGVAFVQI